VLVGDGPLAPKLKQQAHSVADINFQGWLPEREVRRWMRGAIALCAPSVTAQSGDSEGLPNVVIEAMAQGVPVIGSRHSGIIEAVEHGRTGFLITPRDPRAIADAVVWLLERPHEQRAMAEAARRKACESFDAIQQSRRLEELLLSVNRTATPAA
jgi:glycosyltransferase involved in cell wall biosynthesis